MLKAIAAGALLLGSGAVAQTTPTNPDILSPSVSAATPGGAANPSDTGTSPAATVADAASNAQGTTSHPTAGDGRGVGKRQHRPR